MPYIIRVSRQNVNKKVMFLMNRYICLHLVLLPLYYCQHGWLFYLLTKPSLGGLSLVATRLYFILSKDHS